MNTQAARREYLTERFSVGEFCRRLCFLIICYRKKWSWSHELITSSRDISITDYKNRTIQKNFYTTLFMPLPMMLYNCCYNWCILDCSSCDALQFFCCWTLDYIFVCFVCSVYVLCVSNPAVAVKSNKPLLFTYYYIGFGCSEMPYVMKHFNDKVCSFHYDNNISSSYDYNWTWY